MNEANTPTGITVLHDNAILALTLDNTLSLEDGLGDM